MKFRFLVIGMLFLFSSVQSYAEGLDISYKVPFFPLEIVFIVMVSH